MNSIFGSTLILGAGPAALLTAVNISKGCWSNRVGLANRQGAHTDQLKSKLQQNGCLLTSKVHNETHRHLAGEAVIDRLYEGFADIDDSWHTLILCTPSDSYIDIIRELRLDERLQVETLVLLSPGLGSNLLVSGQLKERQHQIDVISLSTYYAATKFASEGQEDVTTCLTKALKQRVYLASSRTDSTAIVNVKTFIESLGVQCTMVGHTLEAESRNITTYVHPPFFMNEFSLQQIYSSVPSKKSMYKLYPEGPITGQAIRRMVLLWREISDLIRHFGAEPFNLLQFLNDDNYPVHEYTLSREDIERFNGLEPIHQEYLLYTRYTAILIDPFSTPDINGKYYDFSAVPFRQVYQDGHGKWKLPRIPSEDYKRLKLIYGLACRVNRPMPQALELIMLYEDALHAFVELKGRESLDSSLFMDTTEAEVEAIIEQMRVQL